MRIGLIIGLIIIVLVLITLISSCEPEESKLCEKIAMNEYNMSDPYCKKQISLTTGEYQGCRCWDRIETENTFRYTELFYFNFKDKS